MKTALILIGLIVFILILGFIGSSFRSKTADIHNDKPPTPQSSTLANPASVNCAKQGGTLVIQTIGNGGQYGLCNFGDNMACEEWALMRGDCPVGGIKTTGFDDISQKYCAWLGGQTFAVPNAKCTFKNGKICDDKALYAGTCSPN